MRASALLPLGIACCLPALCAGKPSTDPQTADDREGMEEVTVTARGDDPLAAQQNASAVELDGALLGSLPAKLEDPLAVASLFVDPAANGAGGTRIVVDGVEGDTLDVPSSSVKTVAVDSNPYSAEFSRPGKGRIEVTTWGGSLVRQHRRFELAYRDNHFDATNPFDTVHPSRQRDWGAGQFDGPWLGGKATFFVGGDYLRDNDNSFTTALTPSGAVSEPLPFPRRTAHLIARSDFRTPLHTLSLRYNWSDDRQTNQGVGAFDLPERAWNSRNRTHELRISDVARVGTDFRNDLRFDFRYRPKIADSMSDAPAVLVNGAFNGGGAQVSRQSVEKDIDFQDLVSYRVGPHSLRFGGLAKSRLIDYTDASNFGGTYTFSDLPNFVNNLPRQYTVNGGNPRVRFTQNEFAYFLQDEIRLRPRLNLLLGLRHELQSNLDEHANLAPRLALSAASEDGRTIVRAGSGIFYQRQPVTLEEQYLLLDGSNLRQVVLTNPSYPLTGDPFAQAGPPNVLRLAPHLRAPYDIQASLGVERKLGEHTTLTAEYTRLGGRRLYRMRDINAPLPATGIRPDPNFLNVDQFETTGSSRSDSLSLGVRATIAYTLHLVAQYTFSRATDDTSCLFSQPGLCRPPADSYNLAGERGPADYDQRHRFNLAGVLYLPGHFTLGCVVSLSSGTPYDITTGFDDNQDTVFNDRPTLGNPAAPFQSFGIDGSGVVGGTPGTLYDGPEALFAGRLVQTTPSGVHWLIQPGPGNVGRNSGRGPSFADVDLRVAKRFVLREKSKGAQSLELRLDAFNLLNHVNYFNYVGTLDSRYFGRANHAHVPREIQLSVRARL